MGWRCTIIDGDGHSITSESVCAKRHEDIFIGNHVWLASEVTVLKGSHLANGNVVASKGCITKKFKTDNLLIGGCNKILKQNIKWER